MYRRNGPVIKSLDYDVEDQDADPGCIVELFVFVNLENKKRVQQQNLWFGVLQ